MRLSELADQEWIIRAENHSVAEVLRGACRQAGFEPRIAYASHDYQEAQAMVAVGLSLALAPSRAVTNRRSDVRLLSVYPDQSSEPRRWPASCTSLREDLPTPVLTALSWARCQSADASRNHATNGGSCERGSGGGARAAPGAVSPTLRCLRPGRPSDAPLG
ncbi:LysR substrate-binding domain-containing protein [Streptomyces sp. BA2]|uniref:LysR substrate-binding domain-containing protein n=1 Tax=Streptomyces sp. BA2 TaxID=436595 RepID=UPI003014BFE9